MKPVTSRDKDLLTKEATCAEACFSVHMGYFCAMKCQHGTATGGREGGGKERGPWLASRDCCGDNGPPAHCAEAATHSSPRLQQLKGLLAS